MTVRPEQPSQLAKTTDSGCEAQSVQRPAALPVMFVFDEFEVEPARGELRRAGRPIKVDALVIDLLAYLTSRAGELVSHEELITEVWGGRAVVDNVVSVCMAKLRKALGHRRGERELVLNVYGRGYRFIRPVRRVAPARPPAALNASAGPRELAPFVGREPVMARLRDALEGARYGRGRVCALLGEPGIGKTRAAEVLEQQALAAGARVAWGHSHELPGAPPLWPWVQVLRTLLAALSADGASVDVGDDFMDLARLLPELGPAAAGTGEHEPAARHRTFDAVARLLSSASRHAPWVVVLDDVHRGDASSLELLVYLVDEIARLPVVVVIALRDTELPLSALQQRHLDYALGHRNCERIELERLSIADVTAYTAAVVGGGAETLARSVFEQSEGNPFFMTELLRDVALQREPAPRNPSLPGPALDLVWQRLRRLDAPAQHLLGAASVLGRSFGLPLLAAVAGCDAHSVLDRLDDALASGLVVTSSGDIGRYAFGHDLFRAALYDALPSARRKALHLAAGEALLVRQDNGFEVTAAKLANHFLSALPCGDVLRAVEHAERAADAGERASAPLDAAAMLRRALKALELMPQPPPSLRGSLERRLAHCVHELAAREHIVVSACPPRRFVTLPGSATATSTGGPHR